MTQMILATNNTKLFAKIAGEHAVMHISNLRIARTQTNSLCRTGSNV